MTVQYSQLVLTGGPAVFLRLLLKWRGCVLKLIYIDVIVFLCLYTIISCIYRFALPENLQRHFERLVLFTYNFQLMIPVAFILGFYINLIFSRFWYQFNVIPWGLKFGIALVSLLPGTQDRPRLIRRTCVRYVMGSLILACARVNVVAKKRFPNYDSLIEASVFTPEEVRLLENMQLHFQPFAPLVWATSLVTLAEKEKLITNQHGLVLIINELNSFRQGILNMFMMDYICVPLVYTQVVTLSVYSYFIASLLGRQYIMSSSPIAKEQNLTDFYFPFFTFLEFIIYMGWLKVAETLINPMGEDDEDIDINEVIDFNWKCTWNIVDGMKTGPPSVVRDVHWDQSVVELPHTEESRKLSTQPYRGSIFDLNVQSPSDYAGSMLSLSGARPSVDHRMSIRSRKSSALYNVGRSDEEQPEIVQCDGDVGAGGSGSTLRVPAMVNIIPPTSDEESCGVAAAAAPMPSHPSFVPETIEEEEMEGEDDLGGAFGPRASVVVLDAQTPTSSSLTESADSILNQAPSSSFDNPLIVIERADSVSGRGDES